MISLQQGITFNSRTHIKPTVIKNTLHFLFCECISSRFKTPLVLLSIRILVPHQSLLDCSPIHLDSPGISFDTTRLLIRQNNGFSIYVPAFPLLKFYWYEALTFQVPQSNVSYSSNPSLNIFNISVWNHHSANNPF